MDAIKWINLNQTFFSTIFTFVMMVATVIYASLTWRMMRETTKMRKAQTEPQIAFFFEQSRVGIHFLDLVIKNTGFGVAHNVTFKILEEFPIRNGNKLSNINFIREGIKYMPPNYSIRSFILSFLDNYEDIIDKKIKVEVSYNNSERTRISEIIILNMSQFKGIQSLGEDELRSIAKNMESMNKNIENLTSGSKHLKVDTYNSADREKIQAEYKKALEKQKRS